MTTENIDALFAATLIGDEEDESAWQAISQLRLNGDDYVFQKAAEWCTHFDPKHRACGAAILGQLRAPRAPVQDPTAVGPPIFVEESFQIITDAVLRESDYQALGAQLFALGHLYKPEAVPILIQYAAHPNEDIRFASACSLGHFPQNPAVIEHLMKLADDSCGDVRNWSLFALGTLSDFDSSELREIFVRHLDDSHQDAREESIAGLAKRKDVRAAPELLRLLQSGSYSSHHEYDFKALLDIPDEEKLGVDDFIDVLRQRFPEFNPS